MKVLHAKARIDRAGATALFVVHDRPEDVRAAMLHGLEMPYPVLVDIDRTAYRAWGLSRSRWWRLYLDPAVWRQYARLLRGGERWRRSGRDTLQLGGDFVVGPDGVIVYARPQQADDRPPVGVLVKALEAAR